MMRLPHSSVHPDRLVGIASVDLSRPMFAIRELRRASANSDFAVYVFCPGCGTYLPMTGGFTHSMQSVWSLMYRFAYRSATRDPLGRSWAPAVVGAHQHASKLRSHPSAARHELHAVG